MMCCGDVGTADDAVCGCPPSQQYDRRRPEPCQGIWRQRHGNRGRATTMIWQPYPSIGFGVNHSPPVPHPFVGIPSRHAPYVRVSVVSYVAQVPAATLM